MMKKLLKHPWLIIGISLGITVFFSMQLKGTAIENTVRLYMPHKSNSYATMLKTEDTFGSMIGLGISLETRGSSIITPDTIAIIQKISDEALQVKNVEDVDSLTNIDYVHGENGSLVAGNLLGGDRYTGSAADMEAIKQKIVDWQEMYNRVILTDDGKATQIMIQIKPKDSQGNPITGDAQMEAYHEIQKITENAVKGHDLEVRYFGDPVLSNDSRSFMISDLRSLVPLVIVVVLLSLYFSFKSFAGTILPLLTVVISTIWSCGLMAMLHITFTIVSSVIPVCLIACGSAYGIHVLTHYYVALDRTEGEMTKEKHLDAILWGLKDVWIAVLLAAITTIAGFISNLTSPIQPLRTFSIFAALGVAFSLLLSIVLIPALLYVTPIRKVGKRSRRMNRHSAAIRAKIERRLQRNSSQSSEDANSTTMYRLFSFFSGTKPRLTLFLLFILLFSGIGIKKLVVDTALVNYFPPDSKFRQDISYVDKNLAGSNSLYFVISGQKKGDMTNPEILKAADDMQEYLQKKHAGIGKIVSFTTFIKRMNQVMHVPSENSDSAQASAVQPPASETDDSGFNDFGFGSGTTADSFSAAADNGNESDDFGFGTSGNTDTAAEPAETPYVDPNIAYSEELSKKITVAEGLKMLHDAYTAAGGKTATVEQVVSELEKTLNYNGSDYYEIPYDPSKYPAATRAQLSDLVSQYLLLLSSKDMEKFADDMTNPKSIRTQVELRTHSTDETGSIIADAKAYAAKYFPKGYALAATGNGEMEYTMTKMVLKSQFTSIAFSLFMVFLIISISFKSPWAGLLGAIPLALTILLNFMIMGFAKIHLDLVTSIIASVAIGVGIDYTIHFMETYRNERSKSNNLEQVTKETFKTSGKGIITNAISVGLGFLVLVFSKFIILRYIGILVAIVMFTSSLLAMTIIPGILNAFDPAFMIKKEKNREIPVAEK
ncbi:MAG: MMPL family transporter [Treponema sp.]|jgi:predicted RND superfamily exporter protein|nr:MMPL family transporter [Treponema sp.]